MATMTYKIEEQKAKEIVVKIVKELLLEEGLDWDDIIFNEEYVERMKKSVSNLMQVNFKVV